ncbi:Protein kinase-like domain protein [Fusarium austroafricanum]|uniref:Protein kinase-like domain protein n=1 Tax=Fusarium austroafricanum TaxID=2364996 RepID=A0A8H4KJC6_9HYPO|nr:Protein kinase-like domain protein [Fusarium austroafricanum]
METSRRNSNVRLVACLVDADDIDKSDYRFVIGNQHAKYVITEPGTFLGAEEDRTFEPVLFGELFPPFLTGDWNQAYVSRDPVTGKATFVKIETAELPGVKNCWHPLKFNEMDFTRQERLRQGVHVSTHPILNDGKSVLARSTHWPWEIPYVEAETTTYRLLQDSEVGPKFLGHITEGRSGRVIGFVTEFIEGSRPAEPRDIKGFEKALRNLHKLGIKLGDTNRFNFLVRDEHDVVLVDFEAAKNRYSQEELEEEMDNLMSCLEDTSFLGGVYTINN